MVEQRENPGRGFDAVLGLLGLTQEEERAAREFFCGQAGEEVLAGISFLDLEEMPRKVVADFFLELGKKRQFAEFKRLFLLVFARGQATCYGMMPPMIYGSCRELCGVDGAKRAAVYGALIGMNLRRPNIYALDNLLEFADHDLEMLKRALAYEKNKAINGKLVLLAMYFWVKYGGGGKIAEDDLSFLALYEKYAVMCLTALCFRNPADPDYQLIRVTPKENPQTVQAVLNILPEAGGMRALRQKLSGVGHGSSWGLFRLTAAMAYLNYRLSERLKNIVVLCAAVNPQETLNFMQDVSFGTPLAVSEADDAHDMVFGIDSEVLIRWAYEKKFPKVLKRQIAVNTGRYLAVMKTMKLEDANKMLAFVREQDSALHARILADRARGGQDGEREKVIAELMKKSMLPELAGKYLRGDCGAELLYPENWLDVGKHYYAGGYERDLVDSYLANCEDAVFLRRCRVYMLVCHGGYFFRRDVTHSADLRETADADGVAGIFADFEAEGVPLCWQVFAVGLIYDTLLHEAGKESFLAEAADIFAGYLKEDVRREELVRAFAQANAPGRFFGLLVLRRDVGRNKNEILAYAQDGAKSVRQGLLEILCGERGFEAEVLGLLSAKQAAKRELAVRVLVSWQGADVAADYRGVLVEAFGREKNAKVRDLLREALQGLQASCADLVEELHGGGRARGLAWAYEMPFPAVHTRDGGLAEEKYLQAVLLCYSTQKEIGLSSAHGYGMTQKAEFLAEILDGREFAAYVNALFDRWLSAGAQAKRRFVLYVAAIHGGDEVIGKFARQIKEWSQHGRREIACEAVRALGLSPLPQALLAVDGMARKLKSRTVREAARAALQFAAAQRNLTCEELADQAVPDFGFDEKGERYFNYGGRGFYVVLTAELDLEVFGALPGQGPATRKKLKNLPAPGKKDDAKCAAAAYEEFKQIKKQLTAVVLSQKHRMEQALATAREWEADVWVRLFVKNPVMRPFAAGLVWGVYRDGELLQGFRYMEDGTWNTEEGEEFIFPTPSKTLPDIKIRLVHPLELPPGKLAAWKGQLSDYEVVQPLEQLGRAVYTVTKEEAGEQEMLRFYGRSVPGVVLDGRLLEFGWQQALAEDAGRFFLYYRVDADAGLAAEMEFSGNYSNPDFENGEVVLYGIRFYRVGDTREKTDLLSMADGEGACRLGDVPARYFSEVLWQVMQVIA